MSTSLPDIYPNSIGDEAYADFQPIVVMYGDPNLDLALYLNAFGNMLKQVDDISKDGPDGEPGWSQIFDLERAKTEWLPWMGQLVGYEVPARPSGQSLADYDAQQRERIVTRSGYRRGTTPMLADVIAEQLNEPKRVIIQERVGDDPYLMRFWVYTDDIRTSEGDVLRAALKQKRAGLIMEMNVLDAADYDMLRANSATYAIAKAKFADYAEVKADPGKV